ncbi:MAG: hypothetical protein ACREDA_12940, partial [Methylocella sp.]
QAARVARPPLGGCRLDYPATRNAAMALLRTRACRMTEPSRREHQNVSREKFFSAIDPRKREKYGVSSTAACGAKLIRD